MVGFVVDRHYVLHAHEVGHHPLQHLAFGLKGVQFLAPALEQRTSAFGEIQPLAQLEGVVVGDDDLGPVQVGQHVVRDQLATVVVAVRVVRLEHAQPVADGDAGRNDQEAAREPPALRPTHCVDSLPRDEHRHHRGLSRAGRQLQGEA